MAEDTWFVRNVRELRWFDRGPHHWEVDQEDFLEYREDWLPD